MQHVDEDVLAMLALGSEQPDTEVAAHLQTCARCRDELAGLTRVVRAGRAPDAGTGLVTPPARVWDAVTAALAADPGQEQGREQGREQVREQAREPSPGTGRRRSMAIWLAAAAGVVVGASASGVALTLAEPDGPPAPTGPTRQTVAVADLAAFEGSGSSGTARIYRSDGGRVLQLRLEGSAPGPGFREVWLLDAESGELVSLGVLNGTRSRFGIPDALDLGDYPVVDVSEEPLDGDPSHSGDSIARGDLDL